MNLESQLRAALRHKQPPAGFRESVLAATRRQPRLRPAWRAIAAAALLTLLAGGTTARWVEERREGQRAKEQVLTALRITTDKLRDTRETIHEASNH